MTFVTIALSCDNQKNCGACQKLSIGSFCGKCYNSFYNRLTRRCDTPEHFIPKCVEYNETDSSICRRFEFGYGLNNLNRCEKCQAQDCARCDDNLQNCDLCFNGVLPIQNTCIRQTTMRCEDPLCDICDATGKICFYCADGFSLNHEIKCAKGIMGCQIISLDSPDQCSLCHYDHFIDGFGLCVKNLDHRNGFLSSYFFWISIFSIIAICVLVYINFFKKKSVGSDSLISHSVGESENTDFNARFSHAA